MLRTVPSLRRFRGPANVDRAVLLVDGLGLIEVIVQRAQDGVAELELVDRGSTGGLDGVRAELVAPGERRFSGRVHLGYAAGQVRFVRDGVQRRSYTRVHLARETTLFGSQLDAVWRSHIRDLSAGGVLLGDAESLPLGTHVELQLQLDDHERLWAPGQVVRAPGRQIRAVRFRDLDPEHRVRLQRFVALELIRRADLDTPPPADG